MNSVNCFATRRRTASAACALAFGAPWLAGCGSDRPIDYQPVRRDNGYVSNVTTPPMVAQDLDTTPAAKSTSPLADTKDPLVQAAGDPLAREAGQGAAKDTFASSGHTDANPSPDDDPLARQEVGSGTTHSHWLRGAVYDAHVEVRLNGAFLSDIATKADLDITPKCHRGLNTVTFTYKAQRSTGSALLEVLESEHDPPIPPLATFNSRTEEAAAKVAHESYSAAGTAPPEIVRTCNFTAN